ncbi:hypothetical protein [Sulfurovum mangrovi]|nr:hypothetical protein [Sulfurovum mangrovi]UFH58414.1 hypothetical protein LN246_08630 [Sulfurovum mangrovi]
MSIKNISYERRLEVLIRLLNNHESLETACSKSAVKIEDAKKFLAEN